MKLVTKSLAAACASLLFALPAAAATITVADGETWCDSANVLADTSSCSNPGSTEDLGQSPTDDSVTFLGSGAILGFVRDATGISNNYADAAKITLSTLSRITFSLTPPTDSIFDGTLFFQGVTFADPVLSAGGQTSVTFTVAAGTYDFSFDASTPDQTTDNTSEYLMEVAAVPLPASALLLLGGMGLLGAMRRKS